MALMTMAVYYHEGRGRALKLRSCALIILRKGRPPGPGSIFLFAGFKNIWCGRGPKPESSLLVTALNYVILQKLAPRRRWKGQRR